MSTFSILHQTFTVPDTSKIFLDSYLERVRTYVRRNNLDPSLSDDLAERLAEKLFEAQATENGITEKVIVSIVNSLGEPEDIFRDITSEQKETHHASITKDDVKNFFRREFHRNQKEGIILGVCAGLGETFGINPIWIRIFFILLLVPYGSSVLIYLILWILLPESSRKSTTPQNEPADKRIERQAKEMAEDLETRSTTYTQGSGSHTPGIIWRFISGILGAFIKLFSGIAHIIVFCFLAGISLTLLGAALATIVCAAVFSYDLPVQSQLLFAYIPQWFSFLALIAGLAMGALGIMAASRAVRKPVGNGWFALICLSIILISIFWGVRAGLVVMGSYETEQEKTLEKITIATQSGTTYTLAQSAPEDNYDTYFIEDISDHAGRMEFVASPDNTLTIETLVSVRAHDKASADAILKEVNPIKIESSGTDITLKRSDKHMYKRPMPFAFATRSIRVSVPKNISITPNIGRIVYSRFENVEASQEMRDLNLHSCRDTPVYYSETTKMFTCNNTKEIEQLKKSRKDAEKREREEYISDQNADFFSDKIRWAKIDRFEHIDEKNIIVLWHDGNKPGEIYKLKVTFDGVNGEGTPVITKTAPVNE